MSIRFTSMLKRQTVQFVFRLIIFLSVLSLYLYDKDLMYRLATQPIQMGFNILHLVWLIFMVMMIAHLVPNDRLPMAMRKS